MSDTGSLAFLSYNPFRYRILIASIDNPKTYPIECFAHDIGLTSVRTQYGYAKGSPDTNS
jgi:hypothetical protein